jgi:hypothetical protein
MQSAPVYDIGKFIANTRRSRAPQLRLGMTVRIGKGTYDLGLCRAAVREGNSGPSATPEQGAHQVSIMLAAVGGFGGNGAN